MDQAVWPDDYVEERRANSALPVPTRRRNALATRLWDGSRRAAERWCQGAARKALWQKAPSTETPRQPRPAPRTEAGTPCRRSAGRCRRSEVAHVETSTICCCGNRRARPSRRPDREAVPRRRRAGRDHFGGGRSPSDAATASGRRRGALEAAQQPVPLLRDQIRRRRRQRWVLPVSVQTSVKSSTRAAAPLTSNFLVGSASASLIVLGDDLALLLCSKAQCDAKRSRESVGAPGLPPCFRAVAAGVVNAVGVAAGSLSSYSSTLKLNIMPLSWCSAMWQ